MPSQQELTLQAIAHDRLFVVPDYQRPYAWEAKQLHDLWEDLDLLGDRHHYAGTLVLHQKPGVSRMTKTGTALTVWDVVDGQQRLTTTFLLLDRLRRRLAELPHEDAPAVAQTLRSTYGVVSIGGVEHPKIRLGSDLNAYWHDTILGGAPAGLAALVAGQQRLRDAAAFFDERIGRLVDSSVDDTHERLLDLMRRVTDGLRFLVYEVSSEAEVGVIFETLNERGRDLTELEKIKNYLLYLARQIPDARSDALADAVNTKWSNIFKHLAHVPGHIEDRVLRAHWLATQNPDSRQWRRTLSVKERFPRARYVPSSTRLGATAPNDHVTEDLWDEMVREIKQYADGLEKCALFASELHDHGAGFVDFTSGHARARSANAALRRTRTVAMFYPLIFAARLAHPTDGEFYADVVSACETYAARVFVIVQRRTNAGEPYLNKLAADLYTGLDKEAVKARLAALVWEYADDARVRSALALTENWYHRRGHKYFLYEYERSLVAAGGDIPNFDMFVDSSHSRTTEHVLPQSPEPDALWWDSFTAEQHEELRHTLGNLVLTFDNAAYSNKEYAAKRGTPDTPSDQKCYHNAKLAQERQIAKDYATWTPETIRHRQERLATWALQRWAVDVPSRGDVRSLEDDLPADAPEDEGDLTLEEVPA